MGDVTLEARDAEKREMNGEAEAIAADAEQREAQEQAALREPAESLPRDLTPQPALLPAVAEPVEDQSPDLPAAVKRWRPIQAPRARQRSSWHPGARCWLADDPCAGGSVKQTQGRRSGCPSQNPSAHRNPRLTRRTFLLRRCATNPLMQVA